MENLIVPIKGMNCTSCAKIIENTLRLVDGVVKCDINYGSEKVKLEFDSSKTKVEELNKKIEPLGYSLDISSIPSEEKDLKFKTSKDNTDKTN